MTQRCLHLAALVATAGTICVGCGNNSVETTRAPIRINELSAKMGSIKISLEMPATGLNFTTPATRISTLGATMSAIAPINALRTSFP